MRTGEPDMDKEQNSPPNQSNRNKGEPLPGTSKDPTGQVIIDQPSQGRQDQESRNGGGSSYRDPNSGSKKGG
jgi:hypothetical protein